MKPILLLPFFALLSAPVFAQPAPAPKPPACTLHRHGWSESGDLVLGARIAAGGKRLELGSYSGSGKQRVDGSIDGKINTFSMGSSELVDLYTQQVLQPRPDLPKKPFYGVMDCIVALDPGDALVFGVAFPRPPDPPKDKDGKQLDYQLELRIPNISPMQFSIPFTPSVAN